MTANPLLRGMYPDPSICLVDGTYYLATSTFEYLPGIPIHTSTDLVEWTFVGHAIHDPAQFDYETVGDSRGMFAPTIRHHDGLFFVACTSMDGGGNFYVTAEDPAGPWSAPVLLTDARGIDPSLFFHEGRAWWIGCREVAEQQFDGETEVWMRELDLARGELVGEERVIWTRTMARAVWAEAPHLYHRDGWFYLMTAEGGTSFEHSVMVARSRDLHGPYLPCPRNPVLTHRHLGHGVEVQDVGHADLVEGADGRWWMVMLATRPIDGHTVLGRETHLASVGWEDDWPVVNPGLGRLEPPMPRAGHWASDGVPQPDDFLAVRGFATFAAPTDEGLELRSTGNDLSSPLPTAALLRRLSSTESTVSVTLGRLDPEGSAGLVLRQSSGTHVRLELGASGLRLIARHGHDAVVSSAAAPAWPITLTARISSAGVDWSASTTDTPPLALGTTPLSALSTETAGGFVGTTFGPYVSGPVGASTLVTGWSQDDRS